jgi:signal peptidase I
MPAPLHAITTERTADLFCQMIVRHFRNRSWPVLRWPQRTTPELRWRSHRALTLFSCVAIGFFYSFQMARVKGHSMEPTFRPGQWLLVRRLNWPAPPLRVGEVIVFSKDGELLVKRIAALPGQHPPEDEHVALFRARLLARGHRPRLSGPLAVAPSPVPPGCLYVLGDNAAVSDDSRAFGPIPERTVIGRVLRWQE